MKPESQTKPPEAFVVLNCSPQAGGKSCSLSWARAGGFPARGGRKRPAPSPRTWIPTGLSASASGRDVAGQVNPSINLLSGYKASQAGPSWLTRPGCGEIRERSKGEALYLARVRLPEHLLSRQSPDLGRGHRIRLSTSGAALPAATKQFGFLLLPARVARARAACLHCPGFQRRSSCCIIRL